MSIISYVFNDEDIDHDFEVTEGIIEISTNPCSEYYFNKEDVMQMAEAFDLIVVEAI